MSSNFERWIPGADALVVQTWYRVLGAVSIHAPVKEVYDAIQRGIVPRRGGKLQWVRDGTLARWDDLEVWPGVKMSIWILGGTLGRNTAYVRMGWWTLYLTKTIMALKRGESLVNLPGRLTA